MGSCNCLGNNKKKKEFTEEENQMQIAEDFINQEQSSTQQQLTYKQEQIALFQNQKDQDEIKLRYDSEYDKGAI